MATRIHTTFSRLRFCPASNLEECVQINNSKPSKPRAILVPPPGNIWECLETIWAVTTRGCYWHLVSTGWGCWSISYNEQESSPWEETILPKVVPRLTNCSSLKQETKKPCNLGSTVPCEERRTWYDQLPVVMIRPPPWLQWKPCHLLTIPVPTGMLLIPCVWHVFSIAHKL